MCTLDLWNLSNGETVICKCKGRNVEDPYVRVVLRKDSIIIGDIPRTISCVCTLFLRCGGAIQSTVTGPRSIQMICCREGWSCLVCTDLRYAHS